MIIIEYIETIKGIKYYYLVSSEHKDQFIRCNESELDSLGFKLAHKRNDV